MNDKKIQQIIDEYTALRNEMAWKLVKEQGYSYQEAANYLGTKKTNVQYIIGQGERLEKQLRKQGK
jgi:predicted transcriptional regulator